MVQASMHSRDGTLFGEMIAHLYVEYLSDFVDESVRTHVTAMRFVLIVHNLALCVECTSTLCL